MKKWSILLIIAVIALLMPISPAIAHAQGEASLSIDKAADKDSATVGETVTYTYTITNNSDNVTISNISLVDDKLGTIDLAGQSSLGASENITATATYTVAEADLPGPIVNTATVSGTDPNGKLITASDTATVSINKTLFWKRDILRQSGVPGKGIDKAPGLQKPFNPKSQAAEHAGKKNKSKIPEQLQTRESVENQGTEQQLQMQAEVQNHAGNGRANHSNDDAGSGKKPKKNSNSGNKH